MKKEIVSKKSYQAIGPYSQAVKIGKFIFCSGIIAVDPKTNNLVENEIKEQTKMVFENLKGVLAEAGVGLSHVVKTTVYLKNMGDFSNMNEIYSQYFKKPYPARATVEVANLPKGALIEIECIAYV